VSALFSSLRFGSRFIWCLVMAIAFSTARAALPASVGGQALPSLAPMLERVLPAVVNISTEGRVRVQESPLYRDPFFRRFFDLPEMRPRERRTNSLGSGVIVDAEQGFVVTNHHVIENADEITVTLHDGRSFEAEVIGTDPDADVAVIRIPNQDIQAVTFGDSDALRVGDFVVAIGNPFGLNQTVTSGIVSALGRSGLGIEGYEDFIQTDASINQGNSGGALVNLNGELVGVNTAILAPGGGNVGIGFSIPINMVQQLMAQIVEHGEVRRGRLGVVVQDLTPDLARAFDIELRRGAVISQVLPGSAAKSAGLREGDVVVSVNKKRVKSASDLRNAIGLLRAGEEVDLVIVRDGIRLERTARIQALEASVGSGATFSQRLAGATLSDHTDEAGRALVVVAEVEPGSPAWRAGLRQADIIVSVNRRGVSSVDEMESALENAGGTLLLNIRRGETALYLVIR
jgi:Do/DeqQ family serine protease